MMSLTFALFTQVSDSGPHGPLLYNISFGKVFNLVLLLHVLAAID